MVIDVRRFVTIVIPSVIVGFVLIALVGKLLISFKDIEDPIERAKVKEVKPVLEALLDENRKRFEHYKSKIYKGLPTIVIYDDTQLTINYRMEHESGDVAQEKDDADNQFHRLLCRYKSFTELYELQRSIKEETGNELKITVGVSGYDPLGETLLWHISITPESCLTKR